MPKIRITEDFTLSEKAIEIIKFINEHSLDKIYFSISKKHVSDHLESHEKVGNTFQIDCTFEIINELFNCELLTIFGVYDGSLQLLASKRCSLMEIL